MTKTLATIFAAALLCLSYSCKQSEQDARAKHRADSLAIEARAAQLAKQLVKMKNAEDSTAYKPAENHAAADRPLKSYGPCPVAIKTCSVVNDLRGPKAIVVTLKNTSKKKITAVKLAWVVYNKKGQQIGGSNGMAKKVLAPGRSGSYSWGINAPSGVRAKATVAMIRYKDGSVWEM